ncbi:MAG: leucine-rich repeat domain-containing protein [Candidatus Helarchaeota archaeon]
MEEHYVLVHGEKIKVVDYFLDVGSRNIRDISEIQGLEQLTDLKGLYLYGNQIAEIKGLEPLTQLSTLNLNSNQLTKISGLKKQITLHFYFSC